TGTTEPFNLYDCAQCHAVDSNDPPADGSGPHRHYSTTTSKCAVCHSVHNAPAGGIILLRGATVSATCLMCHDGTQSGIGPYHTIEKHGGVVTAEHEVDVTNAIPGGSTDLVGNLGCSNCHSVHGAKTVQPFLRDSGFAGTTFVEGAGLWVTSDCLLRSDLNGAAPGTYAEYGARWCAACHDQRHSDSSTVNHPVESDPTWGYGDVVSSVLATSYSYDILYTTIATGMGRTNGGFIMAPAPASGDGRVEVRRDPMCQQCHEDARVVTDPFEGDYTYRGATDPSDPSYDPFEPNPINPKFLTFPHQTTNVNMLVEQYDDLCMNCHPVSALP
ncbi:MAG: cytochrome c3 family protein, partial [Coriobacteriia bacterium]|nr:cytochrome c3 family protein [Coriobacteriia bacterium]